MVSHSFLLALLSTVAIIAAQDCNICGENNSIQHPTGVVRFEFKGQHWRDNCKELQEIVKNPVAISDKFCRNELLSYTVDICRCTDPQGELVRTYYQAPTTSPAPGGPPTEATSSESAKENADELSFAGISWTQQATWSLGSLGLLLVTMAA